MRLARVCVAAALLAAIPWPAAAHPLPCSPREDVLAQLERKFGERPVAIGIANTGGLLELVATPSGSTWTVIVSTPQGISCLLAAGQNWQDIVPPEPEGPQL